MDVIQAILNRHSVRDFSSKSIDKSTIMKIFDAAKYSPSGANGQPWEVFVANGAKMETIRKQYQERAKNPSGGPGPGGPPPSFPPKIQERMSTIRIGRLKLLGLDTSDPSSSKIFSEWGSKLYGAPALAVICSDKSFPGTLDVGMFIQTICLAATGYGLDTMIASALVSQPDILRKELEIPEELNIVTGIAIGYPNPDAIINTYRSPRRLTEEIVRYKE